MENTTITLSLSLSVTFFRSSQLSLTVQMLCNDIKGFFFFWELLSTFFGNNDIKGFVFAYSYLEAPVALRFLFLLKPSNQLQFVTFKPIACNAGTCTCSLINQIILILFFLIVHFKEFFSYL